MLADVLIFVESGGRLAEKREEADIAMIGLGRERICIAGGG